MRPLGAWLLLMVTACAGTQGGPPSAPATPVPGVDGGQGSTPPSSAPMGGSTVDTLTCWISEVASDEVGTIRFEEITEEVGLVESLVGIHGHAAAFGDLDGDPRPDLVVGTFGDRAPEAYRLRGADGPRPDQLLLGGEPMTLVEGWSSELGRTSGAVFADFDGDDDDDLLLVRHGGLQRQSAVPSRFYENDDGVLVPVAEPLPAGFLGRTPAVADFDGDGLLDVYVSEDRHGARGGILLRNEGSWQFTDVTAGSGLEGVFALGATAADLDGDGGPDLVTSEAVFLNTGDMTFLDITPPGMEWDPIGSDDDPAGVAIADVNRDRRPDIVIGHHYRSIVELGAEVAIRLFLQAEPNGGGIPTFTEVTEQAGLVPLPSLAPHLAVADIDNDSWPDIVTSASAEEGAMLAVFRNLGGDPPRFHTPSGLGSVQYWVGAPVADVDGDGRLDAFALEWEPALPSRLFVNRTEGGHWLGVSVSGPGRGVGTVVEVSTVSGDLIGMVEIGVSGGYGSGHLPVAHFGLGQEEVVRVTLTIPGEDTHVLEDVPVDRHLRWPAGC